MSSHSPSFTKRNNREKKKRKEKEEKKYTSQYLIL